MLDFVFRVCCIVAFGTTLLGEADKFTALTWIAIAFMQSFR